jgi:hypothetical protein
LLTMSKVFSGIVFRFYLTDYTAPAKDALNKLNGVAVFVK